MGFFFLPTYLQYNVLYCFGPREIVPHACLLVAGKVRSITTVVCGSGGGLLWLGSRRMGLIMRHFSARNTRESCVLSSSGHRVRCGLVVSVGSHVIVVLW